ncbi:FecR family protein [Legionella pneumophila]|nr:FecR family protein [Legionella pneumophila]
MPNKKSSHSEKVKNTHSPGSQLEPGDTVVTGAGALINIKYKNGTLVNIGENSRYKILAFSPNPSDVQIKAELSQGKIKFKTTGKSNESLKTPVIAMAITGTSAEIFVKSDKQTYLNLLEGNINNYAPGSYIATPQGVVAGAFPAEGQVNTPAGTDGSISDAETSETISQSLQMLQIQQMLQTRLTQRIPPMQRIPPIVLKRRLILLDLLNQLK